MGIDFIKLENFPVRQPHPALFQPHAAPQHALGLVQFWLQKLLASTVKYPQLERKAVGT
jgi:hypothetical protein